MTYGISEKNRKLLDTLTRTNKGPFSSKDAAKILGLREEDARIWLSYFARKGWLSRVKRGLYITVPLGTISPKDHKENPWIIVDKVFSPCYIGGWSAAEYWEFTDQIFNSIVVFTLRKFRNKRMNIKGTEYLLKFRNPKYFGKTKTVWIENHKIQISDPVQTIIDILDDPSAGGGIRNVSDIVREYFNSKYRNDGTIIDYIETRKNRTAYKRLGYLIETLEIDASDLRETCRNKVSSGFTLLDPMRKPKGKFTSRWNLQINAETASPEKSIDRVRPYDDITSYGSMKNFQEGPTVMTASELNAFSNAIVDKLKRHFSPKKVILYGSYAYGNPEPDSDLDLLIIKETSERFIDRWQAVRRILSDPARTVPIETLILTPGEITDRIARGDQFIAEILKKGRVLYAA
jgi:predicted transcriptional regulator of viral defense system/predicted nucleotidyltransferase